MAKNVVRDIGRTTYRGLAYITWLLKHWSSAPVTGTMDLTFVIDSSGSICYYDPSREIQIVNDAERVNCDNWGLMVGFAAAIVRGLEIGPDETKVAAVLFADTGKVLFDLNEWVASSFFSHCTWIQVHWKWSSTSTGFSQLYLGILQVHLKCTWVQLPSTKYIGVIINM